MHNSIPECASITNISIAMAMPIHVKPFEKKVFEEVIFLPKYHQNPQVLKRQSVEKKREKNDWKEKKEKGKRERKRKSPSVSSNKGEVNIPRVEKHVNLKNLFWCDFLPLHHTISKPFPKSLRKFSYLFLDHLLTWQYTWVELYPFS
jgi:hypothetical protein